jgi:hypothetical protein
MDIMRQKVSFSGYAGLLPLLESYPADVVDCSSPKRPDRIWGPPILLFNRYRVIFPQENWLSREVNHSSTFGAKVKNE